MAGAAYYEVYKDQQGKWRWRYLAVNNKVMFASTEGYRAHADCLRCLEVAKASADTRVKFVDQPTPATKNARPKPKVVTPPSATTKPRRKTGTM